LLVGIIATSAVIGIVSTILFLVLGFGWLSSILWGYVGCGMLSVFALSLLVSRSLRYRNCPGRSNLNDAAPVGGTDCD
jgi:hypothetical protein